MVNEKFISVARAGVILKTDRKSPFSDWLWARGITIHVEWHSKVPALYLQRWNSEPWSQDYELVRVCNLVHDPSITDQPCFSSMRIRESDVHDFLGRFAEHDFCIDSFADIRDQQYREDWINATL